MIRLFTVFCKLNQISFSDRQWLEQELAGYRACAGTCPFCGARGCMELLAHYGRFLVGLTEGRPSVSCVEIPRYRCASCGHTHALLSSALVPHRSYSLRFILHVLRCYFLRRKTVDRICGKFGISPSTLYEWKNLFLRQKAVWLGVLCDMQQTADSFLAELDGRLLMEFYQAFLFSLMEHLPRTDVEMPSRNSETGDAVT